MAGDYASYPSPEAPTVRRVAGMFPRASYGEVEPDSINATQPEQVLVDASDLLLLSDEEARRFGLLDQVRAARRAQSHEEPVTIERIVTHSEKIIIDPRVASSLSGAAMGSLFTSQPQPQIGMLEPAPYAGGQVEQDTWQESDEYQSAPVYDSQNQHRPGNIDPGYDTLNQQVTPKKAPFWKQHPTLKTTLVRGVLPLAIIAGTIASIGNAYEAGGAVKRQEVSIGGAVLSLLTGHLPGDAPSIEPSIEPTLNSESITEEANNG